MIPAQPTPIYDQLNTLASIDSSYDKRKAIDELDQSVSYSVSVIIDKIAKNYSYVREDGYRDAYYITGGAGDSEHRVKVLLPTAMNNEVESWNEGETILLEAIISDWDLAYKQFGLLGRSSIVVGKDADKVADQVAESIPDSAVGIPESADETDAPATNIDNVQDEKERDTQPDDLKEPDDVTKPKEEPIVVDEATTDNEELESVESAETNQAQEEVIDLESMEVPIEEPASGNQELEHFIDQMEAPTPLEQLAEEFADAPPSNSEEEISLQTTIPVIGDVPILKSVPTRAAASSAPQIKRFSNHTPVRPTRVSNDAKEYESQNQTKKILKITVAVCVGVMVLMCLCCGMLSKAGG